MKNCQKSLDKNTIPSNDDNDSEKVLSKVTLNILFLRLSFLKSTMFSNLNFVR